MSDETAETVDSDFPLDGLFGAEDPFGPTATPTGPLVPARSLAGQRLDHYQLLTELGRGGMGVVYAAHDEKLDRKVAIKMLKVEGHPTLQRRLVREAKAMAKLAHPNVISVHEIGEHEGLTFIVMEHVEGRTLRRWLTEAPRSIDEIVAVFMAAGRGLAAVHAAGLVHRDFKPDNVMIRDGGQVLVMDLGIARVEDLSQSSTALVLDADPSLGELTQTGMLVGSPGYMPAEQLAGQEATAKSDQFSFCVSLWEALYGQRPFEGHNLPGLMLAVSTGRTRRVVRRGVPAALHGLLERGLRADSAERFESMDALLAALERAIRPRPRAWKWLAAGTTFAIALVSAFLAILFASSEDSASPEPTVAAETDTAALEPRQLTTTGRAGVPVLSPDGNHLVYEDRAGADSSELVHVDVSSGAKQTLAPVRGVARMHLFDDGTLLALGYLSTVARIYRMKPLDGTPEPIGPNPGGYLFCAFPKHDLLAITWHSVREVSLFRADGTLDRKLPIDGEYEWVEGIACDPQNDRVAVQLSHGATNRLVLLGLDGGATRMLFEGSAELSSVSFDKTGDTLYYLASYDQQTNLEATGVSAAVDDLPIPRVVVPNIDAVAFSRADDGRIAYLRVQHTSRGIWRIPANENTLDHAQRIVDTSANVMNFSLSPDETRIAYVEWRGNLGRLMIQSLAGGPAREVQRSDELVSVAWSPDGETLAFIAQHRGESRLWTIPAAGGEPTVFEETLASGTSIAWAPSKSILYSRSNNRNFGVLDPQTGNERPLISNESVGWAVQATVSPDGSTVAVLWNRERDGIWTVDIADGTERFLSPSYHEGPIGWSPDGRFVYDALAFASPQEFHRIPVSGGDSELMRTLDVGPHGRASCVVMTTEELICTVVDTTSDIWMREGIE